MSNAVLPKGYVFDSEVHFVKDEEYADASYWRQWVKSPEGKFIGGIGPNAEEAQARAIDHAIADEYRRLKDPFERLQEILTKPDVHIPYNELMESVRLLFRIIKEEREVRNNPNV